MCLWQKKLGEDRFPWTKRKEEVFSEIESKKLFILLRGIDFFSEHSNKNIEKY
jgi:hypothetical protein